MQLMTVVADRLAEVLGADGGWQPQPRTERDVVSFSKVEVDALPYRLTVSFAEDEHSIRAYPSLGVADPETSRLNAVFLGLSMRSNNGVTSLVGSALVDVMPAAERHLAPFTRWAVTSVRDVGAKLNVLSGDIDSYGLPYLRRFRTMEDCIAELQQTDRYTAQSRHLATALALSGRFTEALPVLHELAAEARGHEGPMATQSWGFIRAFTEHFGLDGAALGLSTDSE